MSEKLSFYAVNTADETTLAHAKEAAVKADYAAGLKKARKSVRTLGESEHLQRPEGSAEQMLDAAEEYLDAAYSFSAKRVAKGLDETARKLFNADRRTYTKLLDVWKGEVEGARGRKLPGTFLAEVKGVLEAKDADPASAELRGALARAFGGERTPEEALCRRMTLSSRGIINYQLRQVYTALEERGVIGKDEWGSKFEGVTKKEQLVSMLRDPSAREQAYAALLAVFGGEKGILKYAETNSYLKAALGDLRQTLGLDEQFHLKSLSVESWRGSKDEVVRREALVGTALKTLELVSKAPEGLTQDQQKARELFLRAAIEGYCKSPFIKYTAVENNSRHGSRNSEADNCLGGILAFMARVEGMLRSGDGTVAALEPLLKELAAEASELKNEQRTVGHDELKLYLNLNIHVSKNEFLKLVALGMDGFRYTPDAGAATASSELARRYFAHSRVSGADERSHRMIMTSDSRHMDISESNGSEEVEFMGRVLSAEGSFALSFVDPFHSGDFRYNAYRGEIVRRGLKQALAGALPGIEAVMDATDFTSAHEFLTAFLGANKLDSNRVSFYENYFGDLKRKLAGFRQHVGEAALYNYTEFEQDINRVINRQIELTKRRERALGIAALLSVVTGRRGDINAFLEKEAMTEVDFVKEQELERRVTVFRDNLARLQTQLQQLEAKKVGGLDAARLEVARRLRDAKTIEKLTNAKEIEELKASIARTEQKIKSEEATIRQKWQEHKLGLEQERMAVATFRRGARETEVKWGEVIDFVKDGVPDLDEGKAERAPLLNGDGRLPEEDMVSRWRVGPRRPRARETGAPGEEGVPQSAYDAKVSFDEEAGAVERQIGQLSDEETQIRDTVRLLNENTGLNIRLPE